MTKDEAKWSLRNLAEWSKDIPRAFQFGKNPQKLTFSMLSILTSLVSFMQTSKNLKRPFFL